MAGRIKKGNASLKVASGEIDELAGSTLNENAKTLISSRPDTNSGRPTNAIEMPEMI